MEVQVKQIIFQTSRIRHILDNQAYWRIPFQGMRWYAWLRYVWHRPRVSTTATIYSASMTHVFYWVGLIA